MSEKELLKYGNEYTIIGFVVGNANEHIIVFLPGKVDVDEDDVPDIDMINPTDEEIHKIVRQMDVQEIKGLEKTVLRKSQRQIDQKVTWEVFKRDRYACVYCGADDIPMTIDHIVLWEHMGDTVPKNLNCSCKKCNTTRGSMLYDDWLKSDYFKRSVNRFLPDGEQIAMLAARGYYAKKLPLRKTKRSR